MTIWYYSRTDNLRNLEETFHYDKMNRLTDIYLGNTHSHIVYDPLGRMTDKQADGQTVFANASFAGAPVPPRPHALKSAEAPDGVFPAARQDITYTSFDKVSTIAEGDNTLAYTYGYDPASRKSSVRYPSGFTVNYHYNRIGYFQEITDNKGNTLYRTDKVNPMGQIERFALGNNMICRKEYHPDKHTLTHILTSNGNNILQDLSYYYDGFCNLAWRTDNTRNLTESFTYDHLNRLTEIWLGNIKTGWFDYDPYGRMIRKTADNRPVFASAVYNITAKPHAIDAAKVWSDVFPNDDMDITYTAFDKVKTLAEGSNTLAYTYGYDRQRIFMEEHANGIVRTKRYVGGCEFVTLTENNTTTEKTLTYLSSPIGIFAVVETVGNDENLHYILKDHLGSWTTITDCQGNIEQELSFDAWGNRRNPETWHSYSQLPEPMFDRGFTGHEHLYAFGLINMNGRMYDPLMSSFLSVDAYVQSPDNSQNFNRYAYCLNNPLKYVDPTGWRMEGGYMGNTTQGPSGWGTNLAPAYEPRDLGRLQLPEYDELAWWREGNKMDGGGSVPIIDPSEMTEEQQQTFNNSIEYSCENSSLFRIMYEILENSPVIYKILIGETKDGCAGQFDPNDKSITFRDDCSLSHFFTYSEELFHAFQDENEKLYNEEIEHNYEYEAKVAKFFMFAQFFSVMNVVGNDSFTFTVNYFCPNGIDIYMPTAQTITDSYFLNGYFEGARRFAEWNRLYNPDKTNYQKNSLQNPVSLIRLFK